ncbi:taurine dioxygenase [Neokomagataea tanensis]|uniref:Taurine dioxygenase n=1 Tax=Neokomagataea tanensis TaxID=661191 RepID=A0A4Y6V9Q1_9PROT|nr:MULTISPECIES: taurine dioxygenase [Neokomagataea]QDH25216.1 taurine dioxygenase [Neokomagataea tanensis]
MAYSLRHQDLQHAHSSSVHAVAHGLPAGWSVRPLSPSLGAVVQGVDLAKLQSREALAAIKALLLEHEVLFFRQQDISPQQHRALGAAFGHLHIHPVYPSVPGVPEAMVLDTDQQDLKDNALWHTDVTFSETPPLGAILAARHLPPCGGDTLWASGTAAYEALSPLMKEHLESLTAIHDFTRSFPLARYGQTPDEYERWKAARDRHPPVEHPVIRVHPESGRRALFVSEGFTTEICGIEADESSALLNYLFRHATKPEFQIRWSWQEGDVAFWDNRTTQHYAVDDYRPHRRIMHRVTIVGDRPFGPSRV